MNGCNSDSRIQTVELAQTGAILSRSVYDYNCAGDLIRVRHYCPKFRRGRRWAAPLRLRLLARRWCFAQALIAASLAAWSARQLPAQGVVGTSARDEARQILRPEWLGTEEAAAVIPTRDRFGDVVFKASDRFPLPVYWPIGEDPLLWRSILVWVVGTSLRPFPAGGYHFIPRLLEGYVCRQIKASFEKRVGFLIRPATPINELEPCRAMLFGKS
jgi:hypothetical protein